MNTKPHPHTREFDVVVIGAGPAGEVAAGRLGQAGLSVAIVENHLIGGECSYYGCMPSKALLRPAEAVAEARRIPGAREAALGELDVEAVLGRRDEVIHDLDDSVQIPWLEERNVTVIRGRGRLAGERLVRVGDELVVARQAVIVATGTGPVLPPIPGLSEVAPWTNREATTASAVPRRLLVLGGGVVGVELAQAWSSLGSSVTLIELSGRILVREEPFASEDVTAALLERGVGVRTGVLAVGAARVQGEVILELQTGERLAADELLVAVGRRPATDDLGLETIGRQPGGFLTVDDHMRVEGSDWLYSIGDVNGRSLLTHMGKYQAWVATENILGGKVRVAKSAQGSLAPRVVFTDPQVAAVGHTLESALAAELEVIAVDHPTGGVAGASFYGRRAAGTSRIVVDTARKVIVVRPSPARRSPSCCMRPRSPSSARCRSSACATRCPPSPRGARSGCDSSSAMKRSEREPGRSGASRPSHDDNDRVMPRSRYLAAATLGGVGLATYVAIVRGSLTLDLGIGRSVRSLGPLSWSIAAPRELVFEVISAPYLRKTPRALERKLRVLERGEDIVLAEHYTQVGPLVTTTLETVRFEPPERVRFRLARGPVPSVVEEFLLRETDGGTELEYRGELGTDLWLLGRLWGAAVARTWEATVRTSLDAVAAEAERRAVGMSRA